MTTALLDKKTIKFNNIKVPSINTKVKLVDETVKLKNEVDEAVGKLNLALRNSYKIFCDYNEATIIEQNLYRMWICDVLREVLQYSEDKFEPTIKTKTEALLVQYVFNGLDRKTRSKYAKVLTDACNDKIEVKGLNKIFGSKQILKNVSFILEQQEHLVIIGSSGAGKSMLVKCILGLENISSGSIFFDGNLISENSDKQKVLNKLGVCFQSNALFDSYNVWENIAFKSLYNDSYPDIFNLKKLAVERLEEVGLPTNIAEQYPSELSGGMQKRVGIARSIFSEPDILIFDEPTTGLDPIMSKKIISLIGKIIKNSKKTAITITHDINLALFLASKIILIDNGKVEWSGTPKQAMLSKNKLLKIFLNG